MKLNPHINLGYILGFPSGGTTILQQYFNSFSNSFALSEPFWEWFGGKNKKGVVHLDKLGGKEVFENPANIRAHILDSMGKFDVGFVKETWSVYGDKYRAMRESFRLPYDVHLFVFREPALVADRAVDAKWAIVQFEDFWKVFQKFRDDPEENIAVVSYERFCWDPVGHLRNALDGFIDVPEQVPELKESDFSMGNTQAFESTEIQEPRTELVELTEKQASRINKWCHWSEVHTYLEEKYW